MARTTRLTRARWAAIGAAIAVTLGGGGLIGVSASGKGASDPTLSSGFTAVSPVRILDTRGSTKPSGNTTFVQVTGSITLASGAASTVVPTGASTVSMNLTVTEGVRNQGYGFVTAYPCASAATPAPNASSINFVEGVDVANGLSVPLGDTGGLCLNVYGSAHLIVDVNGYFDQIDSYALNRRNLPTGVITIDAGTAAARVGQTTAVVYRDDGTPFIAYGREDDHALMGASCADPACTDITFKGRLFSTAGRIISMDMTIGADGNPIIVYDAEDTTDINVVACSDPHCAFALTNDITTPGSGQDPSITISTDGRPVVASGGGGIWVTVCEDDLCIDEETYQFADPGQGGFARDPDIMVGPKGWVYIAFTLNGAGAIGICDDTAPLCSNPSTSLANQSMVDISSPVISTSPSGLPVIAYADNDDGKAKIAACRTILCAGTEAGSELFPLIDAPNAELALVIGPNGYPTVFAFDQNVITASACRSVDCSTVDGPVTLASANVGNPIGEGISVDVGLDGVPLIAYHDGDTGLVSERLFWMSHSS